MRTWKRVHMIKKILLTGVFVLLAASAAGEYFRYTDEYGDLRFTDDLYKIPEAQRQAVKTFYSENNVPDITEATASSDSKSMEDDKPPKAEITNTGKEQPQSSAASSADTGAETLETTAAELDRMQSELNKTRTELNEEREALEAQAPKKDAATDEQITYSVKVDNLNSRIDQFEKDLNSFNKKVTAFNNSMNRKNQKY